MRFHYKKVYKTPYARLQIKQLQLNILLGARGVNVSNKLKTA